MTESEAKELLKTVIGERWAREQRPILGSQLKSALLERARVAGTEFNEAALGINSFGDFVAHSEVAAVKFREGTDFLAVPVGQEESLKEYEAPIRIRKDFWDAFVSFPQEGKIRAYDPSSDRILFDSDPEVLKSSIRIEPIPRDVQLEWRQKFLEGLGADSPLREVRTALSGYGGFSAFSRALAEFPTIRTRWNRTWLAAIVAYIESWAEKEKVEGHPWIEQQDRPLHPSSGDEVPRSERGSLSDKPQPERRKLYSILDQIPLEKLAEIKIPLGWFLGRDPGDGKNQP